jgi:hypothetical protein
MAASLLVSRIGIAAAASPRASPSGRWIAVIRTIIPLSYVIVAGIVNGAAGPRWAGLVSTFPGMSTVVLAVTHLEEGAASASLIARALPPANLSTAAFLAAFRIGCPTLGLAWGASCAYLAALLNLAAIEWISRSFRLPRWLSQPGGGSAPVFRSVLPSWRTRRPGLHLHLRPTPRHPGRFRPPHRRHFAPRLEILPC